MQIWDENNNEGAHWDFRLRIALRSLGHMTSRREGLHTLAMAFLWVLVKLLLLDRGVSLLGTVSDSLDGGRSFVVKGRISASLLTYSSTACTRPVRVPYSHFKLSILYSVGSSPHSASTKPPRPWSLIFGIRRQTPNMTSGRLPTLPQPRRIHHGSSRSCTEALAFQDDLFFSRLFVVQISFLSLC